MIVTKGKHIRIEVCGFTLERSCETPGALTVINREMRRMEFGVFDIDEICAAMKRACSEEIDYKETTVETGT